MSARGCKSQFLPCSLLHSSVRRARTFVKCTGFSGKILSVFSRVTSRMTPSKLSGSNRRATYLVKPMPPKGQRGQPTVSHSIEPAPKINWESLPPNGPGYHLNTWESILKMVQFNSVLPSKRHLAWDRSDQRPKLIPSRGVGGCDISR